jgi:NTE family protein
MRKKFVLSLGSGGVRGFVHLGVYKSLVQHNIKIDALYGCSVGSLVGALISHGYSPEDLIKKAFASKFTDFLDFSLSSNGFVKGQKLNKFVKKNIIESRLENLPVPLTILAANAKTGDATYFKNGHLPDLIQASCSIPGVFFPATINNEEYLDGDLCSPTPVKQVRKEFGKDAIIMAVNLVAKPKYAPRKHWSWARWVARDTYRQSLVEHEKDYADLFIDPELSYFSHISKKECELRIEKGYEATEAIIPQLKQFLVTV